MLLYLFLDAYSGYHQIRMKESDRLATSFITPYGTYCYITMPFGLKNAGATYQRTMQKCLQNQLGRNVHAYVDDIAVMSKIGDNLIFDLQETFDNLWKFNMMLTPANASLACRQDSSLASLCRIAALKLTRRKSRQSSTLPSRRISKISRDSHDAWRLLAGLSAA